jgi:hypothetical protein
VLETNIVVLHDQIPHISLPDPPFLRARPHPKSFISSSTRRHDAFVSFCSSLNAKEMRFLFFFLKGKATVFLKFFSLSVVDFFLTCEQKRSAFLDERAAYREYS